MRRVAPILDALAVVIFVVIGRHSHHHGESGRGIASTAWPFLAALAIGWLLIAVRRIDGVSITAGVVASITTVALGMVLRVIGGQGTAVAFIVVALVFNGATMLGWRALAARRLVRPR